MIIVDYSLYGALIGIIIAIVSDLIECFICWKIPPASGFFIILRIFIILGLIIGMISGIWKIYVPPIQVTICRY